MIQGINVELDKQAIRKHIEKQLDEAIQSQLWFVDTKKLASLTCMSERFLEAEILTDVRMRAIEKRKSRKRWWKADKALEVIDAIMSEW